MATIRELFFQSVPLQAITNVDMVQNMPLDAVMFSVVHN